MKGLVLLAMLLMVPTMAYYQKQTYAEKLQGRLAEEVERVLQEEGVEDPLVRMAWLDARISGLVDSLEQRERVGVRVDGLPGLRLPDGANTLRVRGWVELARDGGRWKAGGLMPEGFRIGMVDGMEPGEGWDADLQRSRLVEAPAEAVGWERFLEAYFAEPGNRSVRLQDGKLVLAGEATTVWRSDWLSLASRLVPKERVEDRLKVLPSVYHFAGYEPESSRSKAEVVRLREEIGSLSVSFAGEAEVVDVDERRKVADVAKVMLQSGARVRFVVGVTIPDDGTAAVELGRKRLEAVVSLLEEYGVRDTQLVREVFLATVDGAPAGRVEFLLK